MRLVATSTSTSPRLNGRHDGVALGGLELAVHHRDAHVAEGPGLQPLSLGHRGRGGDGLRLLDGRAHHVDLPALGELLAHELVAGLALRLVDEPRDDRLPAGRRAGDDRHVEVAVHGERQGARDGRGGHVQDVRRAAVALAAPHERVALLDAEAMLLVDDEQAEAREGRRPPGAARACRSRGRVSPLAMRSQRLASLGGGQRRREQLDRRAVAERAARDGLGVLRGEGLGGRHERALQPGLGRRAAGSAGRRRSCPSPRRPAAGAAWAAPSQVGVELVERRELVARELERQGVEEGVAQRRRAAGSAGACDAASAARACAAAGRPA